MAKINSSNEAFLTKLQALYDIEGALLKALPKMEKAASDPNLKEGFRMHLDETQTHVERLEQIFEMMDSSPKKLKCEGIRGIIEDGEWVMKVTAPVPIKDAMIASSARYAEHYEMAGYMSAIDHADMLGMNDAMALLSETLKEEEAADEKLKTAMRDNMEMIQ